MKVNSEMVLSGPVRSAGFKEEKKFTERGENSSEKLLKVAKDLRLEVHNPKQSEFEWPS